MNIYPCWYRGMLGYACRTRGKKWMFVPELGQLDKNIYKHLAIQELIFSNTAAKHHELACERSNPLISVLTMLFSGDRPLTVAGLLLLPQ